MHTILRIVGSIVVFALLVGVLSACNGSAKDELLDAALDDFYIAQTETGLQKVETILSQRPKNARALALRALFKLRQGEGDSAIEDANRALEIDSQEAIAHVARSWYFAVYQEDMATSQAEIEKARQLDPNLAMLYSESGNNYLASGDIDNAIKDFERAVELEPRYIAALGNLGSLYMYNDDLDAAKQAYNQIIEIIPNQPDTYLMRGYVYQVEGDHNAAIEDYSRAIDLGTQDPAAHSDRAWNHTVLGDFASALPDYESAIAIDPENADYYNGAAYCLAQIDGDLDNAQTYITKALELDPDNPYKLDTQGFIYYKSGEYDKALEIFSDLINEGVTFSHYGRGLVYAAIGETEKAINDLQTYVAAYPDEPEAMEALQLLEELGG
jgi:tetratricopeptide (TPR) repeat protein